LTVARRFDSAAGLHAYLLVNVADADTTGTHLLLTIGTRRVDGK
jgi:hypothetical protein